MRGVFLAFARNVTLLRTACKRRRRGSKLGPPCFAEIQVLESRQLLSAVTVEGGVLKIDAVVPNGVDGDTGSNVTVSMSRDGSKIYIDTVRGRGQTVSAQGIGKIEFRGTAKDDVFNNRTKLMSEAWGRKGDDKLNGGSSTDIFHGGRGNDQLSGNGGRDRLFGGRGFDQLRGGIGRDLLDGRREKFWIGLGQLKNGTLRR